MPQCALIQLNADGVTGVVQNIIIADPTDPNPLQVPAVIVADPPDWVMIGVQWDGTNFLGAPSASVMTAETSKPVVDGLDTL